MSKAHRPIVEDLTFKANFENTSTEKQKTEQIIFHSQQLQQGYPYRFDINKNNFLYLQTNKPESHDDMKEQLYSVSHWLSEG